ncbi:electron transfer flavoprotein subunit alpha/FixB family protein [Paenibacillus sp.]|uniref:electron transfer flavoprotein subunit alpha/FixB family protein n=1 Tax=Paenibacillus sp. TaxID=58172 RepID=UPI003567298B
MSLTYIVIAEARSGKLRQVTLEALHAAKIAKNDADRLVAVFPGHQITSLAEELAQYGVESVHVLDHPSLENYNPDTYFPAIAELIDGIRPDAVFLGHTGIGRDLAPMLAAHLNAGQISDVTAIEKSGANVLFTRSLYAGKALEQKRFVQGPSIVTVRPNNVPPAEKTGSLAPIVPVSYSPPAALRSIVKDVVRKASGKVDLTEAKIIVAGGRGVKSAEGFKPLEQLAEALNAAIGASRGACDAGYCDYSMQIGQTGKVVTPEIYIACGISGAIQHLAGMSQSRIIIAINKDPEAPIFQVADYGIVGDLFDMVPLLTEEFKVTLT